MSGAVLFGMQLPDLPEGVTALECVMSIKALDENGEIRLFEQTSTGLTTWEALGMVTTLADSMRRRLLRSDDDDDE